MSKQGNFISQLINFLEADKKVFLLTNSPDKWAKRENKILEKASKFLPK